MCVWWRWGYYGTQAGATLAHIAYPTTTATAAATAIAAATTTTRARTILPRMVHSHMSARARTIPSTA